MRTFVLRVFPALLLPIVLSLAMPDTTTAQAPALTLDLLKNATYPSEYSPSGQAPLRDGEYEWNQPPLRGRATFVDAAVGRQYTAVLIASSTGGSGVFTSLHLVTSANGAISAGPGLFLGDRQRIESFSIAGDRVRLSVITHGPTEPLCCPTQHETREYIVAGNAFRLASTTITQPASGGSVQPVPPKTGNAGLASGTAGLPLVFLLGTAVLLAITRAAVASRSARR
jgi:hypothetical protein